MHGFIANLECFANNTVKPQYSTVIRSDMMVKQQFVQKQKPIFP